MGCCRTSGLSRTNVSDKLWQRAKGTRPHSGREIIQNRSSATPPTPGCFRRRFHRRYNGRFCDIPGYFLSAISVLIYQRVLLLHMPLSIELSIWERGRGRRVSVLSVTVFEKKQNKSNKFALPTFLNSFYSFCLYFSNFIHYEKHYSTVADAAGNRKLSGNSHVAELRTIRPDQ